MTLLGAETAGEEDMGTGDTDACCITWVLALAATAAAATALPLATAL